MERELQELKAFLAACRENMHEPDEQGISARVVGTILDNSFGTRVTVDAVLGGYQEIVVFFTNEDYMEHTINLATLIALARKAVL